MPGTPETSQLLLQEPDLSHEHCCRLHIPPDGDGDGHGDLKSYVIVCEATSNRMLRQQHLEHQLCMCLDACCTVSFSEAVHQMDGATLQMPQVGAHHA